jgi:hypothetical protein
VMGRSRECVKRLKTSNGDAAEFRRLFAIGGNPRKVAFGPVFRRNDSPGARRPEVGERV